MLDVVVIGGGQAGIATAYFLQNSGLSYVVLEKESQIGYSWLTRYDSLTLFTPRQYSSLPGLELDGLPNGLPSKNEIVHYLNKYVDMNGLTIRLNTEVQQITKENGVFVIKTNNDTLKAAQVVIATGPFQEKRIPPYTHFLDPSIIQLHSSEYRNSNQLQEGTTIVVGAGNSGCQIAVELTQSEKLSSPIYLASSSDISFKPLYIFGKSIFFYFNLFNVLRASKVSVIGKWLYHSPEHIYGYELQRAIKDKKVVLTKRVTSAFEKHLNLHGGTSISPRNIIWATGFKHNYSWLNIDSALNESGNLIHDKGICKIDGLYAVGLPWQTSRGSALIGWVKYDAKAIVDTIIKVLS